jgi:signal transduction histidine kinase
MAHDETRSQLRALHAVTRVLATDEDLATLLPKVLEAVATALGFKVAGYWAPLDERLELHTAWTALDTAHAAAPDLPARAWRARGPVLAPELGALAFPVVAGDEPTAIVELCARAAPVEDADELVATLRAIGIQIGHRLRTAQTAAQLRGEIEALHANAEHLSRTNAELDQFAYVTSHDLRAPLRGITNLAAWIEEDLGPSVPRKVRDHIALLKARAARMDRLINGLLELARVGRVRQRPERVEVTELLHETIDLLSPPETARVLIIGAMPTLVAERIALQQVFLNLIGNAIQHAGRKDVMVKITAHDRPDEVELAIADNGVGIPREHHDRVWQLFQTLASRDVTETVGIGLTIVRKQVEANGGRAWIDPDAAAGATLRFTWPRRPASVLQPRTS